MSNARKNYLRLINNKDPKVRLVNNLESLHSIINGETCEPQQDDIIDYAFQVTNNIASIFCFNFDDCSMLFNLEKHSRRYYVRKLDQLQERNFDEVEKIIKENSDEIDDEENISGRNTIAVSIVQRFLTDLESLMKYSVEDIIKNQRKIVFCSSSHKLKADY